jgi:hypothetical protein
VWASWVGSASLNSPDKQMQRRAQLLGNEVSVRCDG